jgi:hypothetical protein
LPIPLTEENLDWPHLHILRSDTEPCFCIMFRSVCDITLEWLDNMHEEYILIAALPGDSQWWKSCLYCRIEDLLKCICLTTAFLDYLQPVLPFRTSCLRNVVRHLRETQGLYAVPHTVSLHVHSTTMKYFSTRRNFELEPRICTGKLPTESTMQLYAATCMAR